LCEEALTRGETEFEPVRSDGKTKYPESLCYSISSASCCKSVTNLFYCSLFLKLYVFSGGLCDDVYFYFLFLLNLDDLAFNMCDLCSFF
jgi:hypothetical protein